jgi:NAD(P)-dependent dehydrogenase (short-subunit alcohol dehydrogenase family)
MRLLWRLLAGLQAVVCRPALVWEIPIFAAQFFTRMPKVVFITGASSGLGLSIAQVLQQNGHVVYGTSRKPQPAPEGIRMLVADVTDAESIAAAVTQIIGERGRLDVVINNAGLGIASPVETANITDVQRILDTNVTGVIRVVQAVLPSMRRQGSGLLINISSIGAEMGLPYRGVYSASKAAVDRLTEALRTELAPFGIQACVIQPGGVRTEINRNRLRAELPADSVYKKSFATTYELIDKSVAEGLEAAVFGRLVLQIMEQKQVKAVYRLGKPMEKLSVLLKRLLPAPVFENMIRKHYGLK